MIPAETKKNENSAEYIIHMYQTEDLILSFNFNLDDIFTYVIKHMSKDEAELKKLLLWYAGVIEQMQNEKLQETKLRLNSTQAFVELLSGLHQKLQRTDNEYQQLYNEAEEDIKNQIALSGDKISNPIQICLNAVYGMLLIQLNGKKVNKDQQAMLEKFGKVLAFLSNQYRENQSL